ncbi:hypothetical protein GBA52_008065 [Prunus armeniaca]|nr:hypothetical protein GBA52_008065 [Prunus armeniaca]
MYPKLTSSTEKNFTHILSFLNHLEKPDLCLSLYNAIIQGLPSNPNNKASSLLQVLELLKHMLINGLLPDNYTVPSVLKACAHSRALREGQQMHTYAIKTGLVLSNVYVKNTLMRLYAVCGVINCVRNLFDEGPQRDLVSWTTLIQGYVKMGLPREGVEAFFDMCDAKMMADEMTLVIVLSACSKLGDLNLGRKINEYIYDNGVYRDVFIGNALVDMYLKCGDADFAYKVFNEMPVRNVVSWNSMISGLAHQGKFKEALDVFREMQRIGLEPDDVTLVGVLNSCTNLGVLELGEWVHAYVDRNRIEADGFIGNALVDIWKDAVKLRRVMKGKNVKKTPGCSSIELDGVVHEFKKGDKSHKRSKDIYKLLDEIMSHVKNHELLAH